MYNYQITEYFKKQLKPIVKKDPELKNNLIETLKNFNKGHSISLGRGIYKLRLKKKGIGKSGGYRLLILVVEKVGRLAPIYIYDKTNLSNITVKKMNKHLQRTKAELSLYALL